MMDVIESITGRASVRAFLDKPVANDTIRDILQAARFAPSGVNTQPWQVHVIGAKHREKIASALVAAHRSGQTVARDYPYYPDEWFEPFKSRRFQCGMALYGALDIKRDDHERRAEVWEANYHFFNAPAGLIFTLDKRLRTGSYLDMGMFLQNVMLAARHYDLETCAQASLADYPDIIRDILAIDDTQVIVCGMSLGYPDPDAPINNYRTERAAVDDFTHWLD